jgi:hypothetical protein
MRMKFYNELEQSWRKLKQDHPEVAKAIRESDNIEKLFSNGEWNYIADPLWSDNSIYRAPMQTEADKFLAKWGGKKVCRVSGISDWIIFDSVYGCCDDSVIGNDNCGLKVVTKDFRDPTWKLWEPPKVKRELKATDLIGWWATNGLLTGPILVDSGFDKVKIHVEWWHVRNLETWRFTKDPSTPLDQWQTLEEICGGES